MTFDRLYEEACATHPELGITREAFATHIEAVVETTPSGLPSDVHGSDLLLACACATGNPVALSIFERTYAEHLRAIIGRTTADAGHRDEALQLVRHHLFVAESGKRPRIAEYAGRGTLLAFVRVIAVRTTLSLLRKTRAAEPDDLLANLPDADDDPELAYLKELYRGEFKAAFEQAIAGLSPRERTLLRYHLVDGMTIDKLASLYDVHRATAARQVARARDAVVQGTRRALEERLGIDRAELESILQLVHSSADVSVRRILQTRPA